MLLLLYVKYLILVTIYPILNLKKSYKNISINAMIIIYNIYFAFIVVSSFPLLITIIYIYYTWKIFLSIILVLKLFIIIVWFKLKINETNRDTLFTLLSSLKTMKLMFILHLWINIFWPIHCLYIAIYIILLSFYLILLFLK